MSMSKGFDSGFGGALGVVAAIVLVIVALRVASNFVAPCPSCMSSGNCILCGGTGKGIVWGKCMMCNGLKHCPECGGMGWKWKR